MTRYRYYYCNSKPTDDDIKEAMDMAHNLNIVIGIVFPKYLGPASDAVMRVFPEDNDIEKVRMRVDTPI